MLNWKNENMNRKKRKTKWEMVINNMYLCFSIHFSFISSAFWWLAWLFDADNIWRGFVSWNTTPPPQFQDTSQSDGFSLHLYSHSVILSFHRNLHRVKEFSVLFFIMMFWWKLVLLRWESSMAAHIERVSRRGYATATAKGHSDRQGWKNVTFDDERVKA